MKVLSLFDGMACGMLAMIGAGVEVDRYVAYEIDKYAVQTSSYNFPMIEHRGDVFKADFTEFEGFDWLVGGSPCTYWSIAQKNNRETEASGLGWELFSQYVRALHEAKPRFFIYENNKSMAPAIRASITETFGFEPICINSALVSAQNRQRLYWVGKRNEDGNYIGVDVESPSDQNILLQDVLESGCDLKEKQGCLDANYFKGGNYSNLKKQSGQHMCVAEPVTITKNIPKIVEKYGYLPEMFNAYNQAEITEKAPTLSTGSLATSSCAVNKLESVRVGCMPSPDGTLKNAQGMRVHLVDAKAVSQTAQGGGLGAKTGLYAIPADKQCDKVYEVKNGFITIKGKTYPIKLADGWYIIRKLTVRECMRLQTVPEWYEFPVSNSQAYKMLGNGWTVDVIVHLITSILMEDKT